LEKKYFYIINYAFETQIYIDGDFIQQATNLDVFANINHELFAKKKFDLKRL
jgi:hypothetical protein